GRGRLGRSHRARFPRGRPALDPPRPSRLGPLARSRAGRPDPRHGELGRRRAVVAPGRWETHRRLPRHPGAVVRGSRRRTASTRAMRPATILATVWLLAVALAVSADKGAVRGGIVAAETR